MTIWYPEALEYVHRRWREEDEVRPYRPPYRPSYSYKGYNAAPPLPPAGDSYGVPSSYSSRYQPIPKEGGYDFQPRDIVHAAQPHNRVSELGPLPPSGPPSDIHPPAPPFPELRTKGLRSEGEKKVWSSELDD
ncbi:hypothetical protein Y032_0054g2464 [Ancylostoma ceylanicum]|nr:hypothetical protein Y032_0054g2464 [Ancylostoma ceylanicum]